MPRKTMVGILLIRKVEAMSINISPPFIPSNTAILKIINKEYRNVIVGSISPNHLLFFLDKNI
jgi:hypothetical protein